ncbi:MAG: hypothetical protein ACRDLS_15700 [Solirubrobacteraceae bacterium]
MDPAVAVMILLVTLIIAALAIYLIATIAELIKITNGLDVVIGGVGEIVAKSAPVNGVLDAINKNLVTGRDLLEGLLLKKAGPDSAGLVESLFPGEGANFLRRVGRSGKVVNVGTVYTRGVGILASLGRGAPIGAAHAKGPAVRDPKYSTTAAAMLYPAPADRRGDVSQHIGRSPVVGSGYGPMGGPEAYVPSATPGVRPGREGGGGGGGAAPPPPPAPAPPPAPGRISLRKRDAPAPPPPPAPAPPPAAAEPAPPPADAGGGDEPPGRMNVRGSRPWER